MRHICFLTGSRGEWGYIRPILKEIENDPQLSYSIIATHMHLLPEFGTSVSDIEKDGFYVAEKIYMTLDGYNSLTMTKSLAILLGELPGAINRLKPDIFLLAGDRGEQLIGAIAAGHLGVLVAHVQAGELSGNIDGIVRHAITKLAHIHFTANEDFANRVLRMGEEAFRVYNTGAPQLDELVNGNYTTEKILLERYRLKSDENIILAVQHPVTEEEGNASLQIRETIEALVEVGWNTIMIYPNADAGSGLIRSCISNFGNQNIRFFRNLPREDYLGLMRVASVVVGNSSSGLLEAPTFKIPAVNIGRRQNGRPQAINVVNCDYKKNEIVKSIRLACSNEFKRKMQYCTNPYGDGASAKKIVSVLKNIEINDRLINKQMAY